MLLMLILHKKTEKEGVRFELTEPLSSSDFKSDAIDHSATTPKKRKKVRILRTFFLF